MLVFSGNDVWFVGIVFAGGLLCLVMVGCLLVTWSLGFVLLWFVCVLWVVG